MNSQSVLSHGIAVSGHKFLLVYGYASDMPLAAQRGHTVACLVDIPGVHFAAATVPYQGEPAVLVGLTDQAAFAFASRHIYGLKGPGGSQPLRWQLMSLKALRCNGPPFHDSLSSPAGGRHLLLLPQHACQG